jgi:hypothetical protein
VHIDREELAWAAGFFDGEGCFSYTNAGRFPMIRIGQTEREPLDRFHTVVGELGKVYGPYNLQRPGRLSKKPQWAFQVTGHERVQAIAALLWFKLGSTKRAQAAGVLERSRTCAKGHPRIAGQQGCGTCTAEYWRQRRGGADPPTSTEYSRMRKERLRANDRADLQVPDKWVDTSTQGCLLADPSETGR